MKKALLDHWPLYASISVLLLMIYVILNFSLQQNQGHLVYALDDAYIHMAMARNFSRYGVWGATRYGFTSTSSSPLWTFLLSLSYSLTGIHQVTSLLLNLFFTLLVLPAAYAILGWYKVPTVTKFLALLSLILLVPLPVLIMSGMEQALQTLISLVTVFVAARVISGESTSAGNRDLVMLLVLAFLTTSSRFEGIFLIVAISGIFLLTKRWTAALSVGVAGFLPVAVYGFISTSRGWSWLPNSVLLKASLPDFASVGDLFLSLINPVYVNVRLGVHALVLLVSVLLVYIVAGGKGSGGAESRQIVGANIALLWVAHLEFVGASPLYRYDAYLCALSIVFLASQLPVIAPRLPPLLSLSTWRVSRNLACGSLAFLFLLLLAVKGGRLLWFLPQCTTNVFEQQYQMGTFVHRYYQDSSVALNDIGAVNFLADIHCLDLWGLASMDVAKARRTHTYGAGDISNFAKQGQVKIAIIYDDWFPGAVPAEWVPVGRWTIPNNVIVGRDTVSIYAVDSTEAPLLAQHLREFSAQLPRDVLQRGPYLASSGAGTGP